MDQARRVMCGVDATGRSCVAVDETTVTRQVRPTGAIVNEVWRQEAVPAGQQDDGRRGPELVLAPPAAGAVVRSYTVPPDEDVDPASYGASDAVYGAGNTGGPGGVPGMHRTDSLDVVVVVTGEIVLVLEADEVVLRQGDTLIVRGEMHAWRNRSGSPATIVSTVFPMTV